MSPTNTPSADGVKLVPPKGLRRLVELAILALVVLLHVALLRRAGPAVIDEPSWITTGYLTFQLYTSIAPPERWQVAYDEARLGDWGNLNPPLGKLWIGVFVAPAVAAGEVVNYQWRWPLSYRQNLELGNLPPSRLLDPPRKAIALTSILLLVASTLVARRLGSAWWASLFVPVAMLALPSYVFHAVHVYVDIPQLALAGLGAAALLGVCARDGVRWVAVAAVLLGASCAVKLNSGVFVLGAALALAVAPDWAWRRRLTSAAILGGLALAVFVAVNPYLYTNPILRLREIVSG